MALNIKAKLIIILLIGILSAVIAGMLGLMGMKESNHDLDSMYKENVTNILRITKVTELMRQNRIQLLLALQHNPANEAIVKLHTHELTLHTDQVAKNIEEISRLWNEYMTGIMSAEEKKLAEDFAAKRMVFVKEGLIPVREAVLAGNYQEASELTIQKINPLFTPADEAAQAIFANESREAKETFEHADNYYHKTFWLVVTAIVVSILLSVGIGLLIIRSIAAGTGALITASSAMSQGDLTRRANLTSKDELGQIGVSFDAMAESVTRLIAKMSESSVQVASAASQMYTTAEQMATGTEEVACQTGTVATADGCHQQ
jgi:methyl-accepting chemotaxis protein